MNPKTKVMKTILVPTDFSEQANNALDFAVDIARHTGDTQVQVIHIMEGLGHYSFNTTGEVGYTEDEKEIVLSQVLESSNKQLTELINKEEYADVSLEGKVEVGNPYKGISKEIARCGAELVVMGTRGSSGLTEILIGSNTEKVVRYSKCPVITVKDPIKFDNIRDIVFATNLTEDQTEIVERIKKMQSLMGATVHLLKVNTPNHFHTDRQTREEFDKFVDKHGFTDYTTNIYNEATEEDGILYFAEDVHACMIAIGTHGRTGLLHLLSGSIAEDLVNHSRIPVWTLSMKK